MTPREFLASKINPNTGKPYAIAGSRGKFSNDAKAFLAKAIESGEYVPETPAVVASPKKEKVVKAEAPKIDPKSFNPADVRRWAKENGHEVSARGRVNSGLVRAYLDAMGDKAPKRSEDNPSGKDLRAEAPRLYNSDSYKVPGTSRVLSFKDCCNGCGYSIGWCGCPGGPRAFADPTDSGSLVRVTPA